MKIGYTFPKISESLSSWLSIFIDPNSLFGGDAVTTA